MATVDSLLAEVGLRIIKRDVGGGGSATVHKCEVVEDSPLLPRPGTLVAAKEYRAEILRVPHQVERIQQEAALGAGLVHTNIVQTLGLLGYEARVSSGDDSPLVLLLEWVNGQTLDKWFEDQPKPLPWDVVRHVAEHLLDALTELHQRGVYHRDVKPENVMVQAGAHAVLMDIGVAELASDDESTMHTSMKDFVGSARYASPQFILGEPFEAADDIYALAATLFLLMTGQPVYSEVVRKTAIPIAVVQSAPDIRGLAENVPPTMKVVLQGALHRDRKRRPTLEQFRECLVNPATAAYTTTELARQAAEVRSYPVIHVVDGNATSFFADMAGDSPEADYVYKVVRQLKAPITVPSYSREVTPELWVADAVLKHVHQNVGHFAVLHKRWQEGRNAFNALSGLVSQGQWVDVEGQKLIVQPGDLVLRQKN